MGLRTKFFVSFMLGAPVIFGAFISYSVQTSYYTEKAALEAKARLVSLSQANNLILALWNVDSLTINEILRFFSKDPDFLQVIIFNPDGKVAYKYPDEVPPEKLENSILIKEPLVYTNGEVLGELETIFSLKRLDLAYRESIFEGFLEFLALLLTDYLILTLNLHRLVFTPLTNLIAATNRFSKGDLSSRVVINTTDELGDIGNAFNKMATSIQEYSQNLEGIVVQRTSELEEKK